VQEAVRRHVRNSAFAEAETVIDQLVGLSKWRGAGRLGGAWAAGAGPPPPRRGLPHLVGLGLEAAGKYMAAAASDDRPAGLAVRAPLGADGAA